MATVLTASWMTLTAWGFLSPVAISPTVNASIDADALRATALKIAASTMPVALDGHCPVTLCTRMNWQPGNVMHTVVYQGQRYYLVDGQAVAEFLARPALYAPVAHGLDIVAMVENDELQQGLRRFGYRYMGRSYLFGTEATMAQFRDAPWRYTAEARRRDGLKSAAWTAP